MDPGAVREAVASRTSFSLVHPVTATKLDVFPLTGEPFEIERTRSGSVWLWAGRRRWRRTMTTS